MASRTPSPLDEYKLNSVFGENNVTHTTNTTITEWTSDKVLGSGTFGVVWRQRENGTGELRAVKIISKAQSNTQELETLVNLRDHSDLFVRFLCWFEDSNSIHIAMEYVAHGDLQQYITSVPGDARTNAKVIGRQILSGLVVLHERQICHRDLKPQNILVASLSPISVKITDFGISKHWGGTSLRTNCGTFHYQAPEQLGLLPRNPNTRGNSYSNAVDLWAAGAIIHLMLTSEIPFSDKNKGTEDSMSLLSGLDLGTGDIASSGTIDLGLLLDYCRNLKSFPAESLRNNVVSDGGITLVKSLMAAEPSNRSSAVDALNSVWLGGTLSVDSSHTECLPDLTETSIPTAITGNPDGTMTRPEVHPASSRHNNVTTQECLSHFQDFITRDKPGLSVFYNYHDLIGWAIRGAEMSNLLYSSGCPRETAKNLAVLALYDVAVLINDSPSMGIPWKQHILKLTLDAIINVYSLANSTGLCSVRYLNHRQGKKNVTKQDIPTILDRMAYSGIPRIGTELHRRVLDSSLLKGEMTRPLLVLVITDSDVEGENKKLLPGVLANCSGRLKRDPKKGIDAVAFSFLLIGNDPGAADLMTRLENDTRLEEFVSIMPSDLSAGNIENEEDKWVFMSHLMLGALMSNWNGRTYMKLEFEETITGAEDMGWLQDDDSFQ